MAGIAIAGVPANVILGERILKRKVVNHLLSSKAPDESWAVLDNDNADVTVNIPGARVSVLAEACMCCNAVSMRVALTRLLRETRPSRLLLLPSRQARLSSLMSMLSDRWLAPVLDLRASIAVVDPAAALATGAGTDDTGSDYIQRAQIIAVSTESASKIQLQKTVSMLAVSVPAARVVMLQESALDPALLQEAGPILRRAAFTPD